jgi:hypothetical protein
MRASVCSRTGGHHIVHQEHARGEWIFRGSVDLKGPKDIALPLRDIESGLHCGMSAPGEQIEQYRGVCFFGDGACQQG